ncbi:MAG: patatin family protein [Oscillospiraceae bacterium]|nr:patatin family protein [Oscillospiraceae bacterium]
MSTKKIGIIDVGGGMRGVYGAGLFDYLMDNEIWLPYCVGISAGSANVASYLSRQRGRNKVSYEQYSFQREYMSFHNLLKKGSYVDLDYVYGTLSNSDGTYPWDYDAAMENPAEMIVVATDAKTAQPVYFTKKDFIRDDYGPLKGSSCIPIACRAYRWRGRHYYDGAITDPIPVERAFADGCDHVIVVLTRPVAYRKQTKNAAMYKLLRHRYPKMVEKLYARCDLYNRKLEDVLTNYVPDGRAFVIGPDDVCGVDTIKHKKENMEQLYQKGYQDGEKVKAYLEGLV